MSRVHFSALRFWFGFMKLCSGSSSKLRSGLFLIFSVNFDWIWSHLWKIFFRLVKTFHWVARVHKKMPASGWPKWPQVGSNLGSVLTWPIPNDKGFFDLIKIADFLTVKLTVFWDWKVTTPNKSQFYHMKICNFDPIKKALVIWFSFEPFYMRNHQYTWIYDWFLLVQLFSWDHHSNEGWTNISELEIPKIILYKDNMYM